MVEEVRRRRDPRVVLLALLFARRDGVEGAWGVPCDKGKGGDEDYHKPEGAEMTEHVLAGRYAG